MCSIVLNGAVGRVHCPHIDLVMTILSVAAAGLGLFS